MDQMFLIFDNVLSTLPFEKKEMLKDCYWIAFYPKKYHDSSQALRERIRRNKAIIKDREFETCIRNGKFKTDKMVGF